MQRFNVIGAVPTVDGAASAAIVARTSISSCEVLFFESDRLSEFFTSDVQSKLPGFYTLVLCGHEVVHTDWDGRLMRPHLMDVLRAFVSPVLWLSAAPWEPEDTAAIQHIIGESNLIVGDYTASTAALARSHFFKAGDTYADNLVRLAGPPRRDEEPEWVSKWRRVLSALRNDPVRLREALQPLIEERPQDMGAGLIAAAERVEKENSDDVARTVGEPVDMGEFKFVTVAVPPGRHAFWREISDCARAKTGAHLCLCRLTGRSVLILSCGREARVDLRPWAQYATDMLPNVTAFGRRPDAVPLHVRGLKDDPTLEQKVIGMLHEGAHLLST